MDNRNSKRDLTEFSSRELSRQVYNDEILYNMRTEENFLNFINEMFNFTDEQLEELLIDLAEEK